MVTSKCNKSAFGSVMERFGRPPIHPKLDASGVYIKRPVACDPARYHPKPINCEIKKINKDPWRSRKELEEWAKNLGYRNQKILDYSQWTRSLLGPAWHEIPEPSKYEAACNNVSFGRTPRFHLSKNKLPGPGTYYSSTPYKAPYGPHSLMPSFEMAEPCRFKDRTPNWMLAPNRYTIIDKESIEQKPKKIVSLRGPYDLFTGQRDGSTIKNHFNKSLRTTAATWPIALKGTLDKYEKSHFGRLNKTNRNLPYRGRSALTNLAMSIKNPKEPGPCHYNVDKPRVLKVNHCGFNSSYDKGPGYQRVVVWPGVGRYRVKSPTCGPPGQGHRHVFLSKIQRTTGSILPQPMNSF